MKESISSNSITSNSSYKSENYGFSNEIVEKITSSNPNIDTINVENSADVTIGNRTFFNPSTIPDNLSVGKKPDDTKTTQQSESNDRSFCQNSRLLKYCFCSTVAVIITTFVLVICLSKVFGGPLEDPSTCEEVPSSPSYLTCGYESACSNCSTSFPDKEICESYYAADCGELHCFCRPYCASQDCLISDITRSNNNNQSFDVA